MWTVDVLEEMGFVGMQGIVLIFRQCCIVMVGTLDGVDVEVGALGEAVHRFALCFLVPGQYTLLGSAVIDSQPTHEALSYTGPPFAVHVVETS